MRRPVVAALFLLVVGCRSSSEISAGSLRGDFGRIGAVEIGMSQEEIRVALGAEPAPVSPVPSEERSCYYLSIEGQPTGVRFMMNQDRLVRYEVVDPSIRTAKNVGIGSTENEVQAAYDRRVSILPHKYTQGHYLVVAGPKGLKLLFETDGAVVTTFRAGREPEVSYVEGCS